MSALSDIANERTRQVQQEGWSVRHDDEHKDGSLAKAAACYLLGTHTVTVKRKDGTKARKRLWPHSWHLMWWKPKDRRRDLVRAGALIVAEIERLDRAANSQPQN